MRAIGGIGALAVGLLVLALVGFAHGDDAPDETPDLRAIVEKQQKQLDEQQRQIQALNERLNAKAEQPLGPPRAVPAEAAEQGKDKPPRSEPSKKASGRERPGPSVTDVTPKPSDEKKETQKQTDQQAAPAAQDIEQYLKDNPGAGMPPGVQTGFDAGRGFFIRSPPNPPYVQWQDEAAHVPFEMRFRGRIQTDYYFYKVTDNFNHLTKQSYEPEVGDFSQLEVKRLRLFWEGTAFTPDLFYQFQLDGNTRGLAAWQSNKVIQTAGSPPAASSGAAGIGTTASAIGGNTLDAAGVRLFTAFVGYDIHLGGSGRGCTPDCPEGTYRYSPTLTFLVGKQQPFFGLTEILGSANAQFVDFSMADWFFDADDNNMLMAVTAQLRAVDDRLFAQAQITNGNDSQFPNQLMDRLPGFIMGGWYDLGGSWNEQAKRWNLWGYSVSDLEYSVKPVLRIGGAVDLVPMDRRSIYGDAEQSRVLVMPGAPGGTRLINLLDGDSVAPNGSHAVDKFDYYTFDSFAALHFRGLSIYNEWWCRILSDFQTTRAGGNAIIYQDGSGHNALFPGGPLIDAGTAVQMGYFFIPKKLEVAGRWDMISGDSGDINGTGRFSTVTIAGASSPVRVINGAFRQFQSAQEWSFVANYFFYGQLLKWSSDVTWYQGGNPAAGGASAAGFIAGVDGWMVRTQLQMAF